MTDEQLCTIYREIMSSALALEKTMTIAYLGPEATFTHQAAIRRFGSSLSYASQKTIATCSPRSAGTARITASCRSKTPPRAWSRTRSTCSWTAI